MGLKSFSPENLPKQLHSSFVNISSKMCFIRKINILENYFGLELTGSSKSTTSFNLVHIQSDKKCTATGRITKRCGPKKNSRKLNDFSNKEILSRLT